MAMSTWWKVENYRTEITPVEVVKETEKMLEYINPYWKKPQRVMKGTEYFPTFAAARTVLLERFTKRMENAIKERVRAQQEWDKVRMMEPPKDTQ
jgi:hypothetical protein